jgi:putative DNA primase/helicase
MEIPEKLKCSDFRFIKIIAGTKRPVDDDWNLPDSEYCYKFTDKEFQRYLKNAKAYGVICGMGNLAVIDADHEQVAKEVKFKLPKTFTVKSGSGKWHFYYKIPDLEGTIVLDDAETGTHFGEVQHLTKEKKTTQVLGAGSIHPNGKLYQIDDDAEIAEITKDKLLEVLKPFIKQKESFKRVTLGQGIDTDISIIAAKISGLDNQGKGLQGAHPVHGSDGGMNFRIDPEENKWHCFRHKTGGDALSLIGVLEGIVECEDCVPGYFSAHPEAFKKILSAAPKYGYDNLTEERLLLFKPGSKGSLDVAAVVVYLKSKCSFITVKDCTGRQPHIYVYEDGYYQLNGEDYLTRLVKELFVNLVYKSSYKREVIEYIQTENVVDRELIEPPRHLINFNNGVFDTKSKQLLPHSSDYYFLYKIPWNYNPKAKCPTILKYFKSTLSPEFVKFSQQLFGYCLYYDYHEAGIFYLYGTGGNGKSVWIHLLEQMVGQKNYANKSIDSLVHHRFTSSLLYGKLVNVCGELSSSVLKDTDMLKRLSSGDSVQAEFKGKDGFDFYNRAKIITSCNAIPYCTDLTAGWYQRQYVIPFLKQFRNTEADNKDLKTELTNSQEEMEGLITWAIEGLVELLKNRKFSYPGDHEEKYLMYQQNTSYFIDNYYYKTTEFNDVIPMSDIYDHYVRWCEANEIPLDSSNSLGRQLTYRKMTADRFGDNRIRIRRYIKPLAEGCRNEE